MEKQFEELFTEIQSDMVSICMEYCGGNAEKIHIHCLCEQNVISCNPYFIIAGKITKRSQMPNATDERQKALMHTINDDIKKIKTLCVQNKQPVPTGIKLAYDVASKTLSADYSYDAHFAGTESKTAADVFAEWMR